MTSETQPTAERYDLQFVNKQYPFYDKDNVLCFMTMDQFCEELGKPKNRFTRTTLETVLPPVCMGLGILLLAYVIASGL